MTTRKELKSLLSSIVSTVFPDDEYSKDEEEGSIDSFDEDNISKAFSIESLSSSSLSLDLMNLFKSLYDIRGKVIVQSHMFNCGLPQFDFETSDVKFDDYPSAVNDGTLFLSEIVTLEDIDALNEILQGIATKRNHRGKDSKVLVADNKIRANFLRFIKNCWESSGAEDIEEKLLARKMLVRERNFRIQEMEKLVSTRVSDFLFLGYSYCRPSNDGN